MNLRSVTYLMAVVWAGTTWLAGPLQAQPYAEDYNFGPAYVPAFANKTNGPDMLPLTADDGVAVLNLPGAFSCDVIDLSGATGGFNADFSFHNRKTDDDEQLSLTAHSEFGLGIIAEGENWCDMRQDNGAGATGAGPDGTTTLWNGNDWDWETNDSSSTGYEGWETASDYFWYNNHAANQRGLGGSKYYFEYKNPDQYAGVPIFDEPEKYRRANRPTHTWAADVSCGGTRRFGRNVDLEIRGFLIPVSEIHTLAHGSLHPLFGWQSIDLADYVRDTIGDYIDPDGNPINGMQVWDPWGDGGYNNAAGSNPPPYKYLYIFQTSDVVSVLPDTCDALAATFYGIVDGVSGTRRCHIMFKGDNDDGNLPIDITRPAAPEGEPQMTNGWGRDDMLRANYANGPAPGFTSFGNLQTGGIGWEFSIEGGADDGHEVKRLSGAATGEAWVKLPTMALPARNLGVIQGKARMRLDTGLTVGNLIHLALVNGDDVVASGVIRVGRAATAGLGGTVIGGPVSGSIGSPEPPTPDADGDQDVGSDDVDAFVACGSGPEVMSTGTGCSKFDFDFDTDVDEVDFAYMQRCISGDGNAYDFACAPGGTPFAPGSLFFDLALWYDASAGTIKLTVDGNELASYSAGAAAGAAVDGLYVWTSSGETIWIDTLAVYSGAFTCSTTPGDVDGDGDVDAADAAARTACYSGSGQPYRTGIFPSCACLDTDGDYDVDEADGVTP